MRKRPWWWPVETMLALTVVGVSLHVLLGAPTHISFYKDESRYIWRTRYFAHLFVRRDIAHPDWGDSHWTHTQPMLTNYIVGAWLWSRGYDLERMPPAYDDSKSFEQNRLEGRVTEKTLLAHARTPIGVIAAGVVTLVYVIGRLLGGRIAGLATAAFALASPLAREYLVPAVSEAPFSLLLFLSLLLGVLGARRGRAGNLPVKWALALGLALGLCLGTKLTAVLSLTAVLGWGTLMAGLAAWACLGAGAAVLLDKSWAAVRGWALALVVALGVFVLSNPHLYPNPLAHSIHLAEHRVDEMLLFQTDYAHYAVPNPLDRPGYVLGRSLVDGTWTGSRGLPLDAALGRAPSPPITSRGLPIEAALAALGASVLLVGVVRCWRTTGQVPAEGLVLLTALVYFVGIASGLLLAWSRYLVPTLLFGTLFSGLGVAVLSRQLVKLGAVLVGWLAPVDRSHARVSSQASGAASRLTAAVPSAPFGE